MDIVEFKEETNYPCDGCGKRAIAEIFPNQDANATYLCENCMKDMIFALTNYLGKKNRPR